MSVDTRRGTHWIFGRKNRLLQILFFNKSQIFVSNDDGQSIGQVIEGQTEKLLTADSDGLDWTCPAVFDLCHIFFEP